MTSWTERQALKISSWGSNVTPRARSHSVCVLLPPRIKELAAQGVKLNVPRSAHAQASAGVASAQSPMSPSVAPSSAGRSPTPAWIPSDDTAPARPAVPNSPNAELLGGHHALSDQHLPFQAGFRCSIITVPHTSLAKAFQDLGNRLTALIPLQHREDVRQGRPPPPAFKLKPARGVSRAIPHPSLRRLSSFCCRCVFRPSLPGRGNRPVYRPRCRRGGGPAHERAKRLRAQCHRRGCIPTPTSSSLEAASANLDRIVARAYPSSPTAVH